VELKRHVCRCDVSLQNRNPQQQQQQDDLEERRRLFILDPLLLLDAAKMDRETPNNVHLARFAT